MEEMKEPGGIKPPCRRPRGRFAPSPSGRMHLGNLFSCLLAWLDARSLGGVMTLRMEDLDRERCRADWANWIADDLSWLGLCWDEGWDGTESGAGYAQSGRTSLYEEAFSRLAGQGLIYPCFCTRAERLAANAPHGPEEGRVHACRCAVRSEEAREVMEAEGKRPAFRIAVPDETVFFRDGHYGPYTENLRERCGDFILRRSDGIYAYQLAVTVDDGLMGVTRVVRGRDLLSSTARQLWLHRLLGFAPPQYCHAPLLLAPDGRRLSKRERDLDMAALRKRFSPSALIGLLAFLGGLTQSPAPVTAAELAPRFSWKAVRGGDILLSRDLLEGRF